MSTDPIPACVTESLAGRRGGTDRVTNHCLVDIKFLKVCMDFEALCFQLVYQIIREVSYSYSSHEARAV